MTDLLITRADDSGRLGYSLTEQPSSVRGLSQLVQEIVVDLMSEFSPELMRGASLKTSLAQITLDDISGATQVTSDAVAAVKGQIVARHSRTSTLTSDERLNDLRLLSVSESNGSWIINLELIPASGGSITISLPEL